MLGSNRLHGSYGRVVEIESTISGFFPTVPCNGVEIVIAKEGITVIPIDSTFLVVLALNCLDSSFERVNRSGIFETIISLDNLAGRICLFATVENIYSLFKGIITGFEACEEVCIRIIGNHAGSVDENRSVSQCGFICTPSSICGSACNILISRTICTDSSFYKPRQTIIVIAYNAHFTGIISFIVVLYQAGVNISASKYSEINIDIRTYTQGIKCSSVFDIPEPYAGQVIVLV